MIQKLKQELKLKIAVAADGVVYMVPTKDMDAVDADQAVEAVGAVDKAHQTST